MAELRMFPNGHQHPDERMARLEAHVFHALQKIRELEAEQHEHKKDREALVKYVLWRIIVFLGLLIGALVSKGSIGGSLITAISGVLTGSSGQ